MLTLTHSDVKGGVLFGGGGTTPSNAGSVGVLILSHEEGG
jgi:hypothetical protein